MGKMKSMGVNLHKALQDIEDKVGKTADAWIWSTSDEEH